MKEQIKVKLTENTTLIAEPSGNPNFPVIYIFVRQEDTGLEQDLLLVKESEILQKKNGDVEIIKIPNEVSVYLYANPETDDYTSKTDIKLVFEGGEDESC